MHIWSIYSKYLWRPALHMKTAIYKQQSKQVAQSFHGPFATINVIFDNRATSYGVAEYGALYFEFRLNETSLCREGFAVFSSTIKSTGWLRK